MSKRRKTAPRPRTSRLESQIERISLNPRTADTEDPMLTDHLQLLAERIQKIGDLKPTSITTQEGALQALPILEAKLNEINEVRNTVTQLRKLLKNRSR